MVKKVIINTVKTLVVSIFFMGCFTRCASIMTPDGGPKDSLPPVVMSMSPQNYTTSFNEKKIFITFDEYVQLKDQQKEFFVSPMMTRKPLLSIKGRGVLVTMRDDSLMENTTYSLNFGSSIVDNNEGNPLNSFRYVFSTGEEIDSMIISGYTVDAYKADSLSKGFIFFYPKDSLNMGEGYDSTMLSRLPVAIARAENNGIFLAQNLKPIDYKIYAFEDTNSNQTYEAGVDKIGFLDSMYNPEKMPDFRLWYDSTRNYIVADPQLYFRLFSDVAFQRQILQDSKRPLQHKIELSFGAPHPEIESIEFDSIPSNALILEPTTINRDTFNLWINLPSEQIPDSIRGRITYLKHDSVRNLSSVGEEVKLNWRFIETSAQRDEREKLDKERERAQRRGEEWIEPEVVNPFKVKLNTSGEVNPESGLTLDFDYPLLEFDMASVSLTSTASAEGSQSIDEAITITQDSIDIRRYYIGSAWDKQDVKYNLTIPPGAIVDIARQSNDSIVGEYKAINPEKYATVVLNMAGRSQIPTPNYIVELLDGKGTLIESKMTHDSEVLQFNYVKAGDISLRIIEDGNYNLRWDTGSLVEMRHPERVEIYSQDGESIFTTKENWEMELSVDLSRIFAPVTMSSVMNSLEKQEIKRLENLEKSRQIRQEEAKNKKSGNSNTSGFGTGSGNFGF